MTRNLFKVTTTNIGADKASSFYFDSKDKAQKYLSECSNGEIVNVTIESDYELNYSDGCTFNDLTFGEFDATETVNA